MGMMIEAGELVTGKRFLRSENPERDLSTDYENIRRKRPRVPAHLHEHAIVLLRGSKRTANLNLPEQ